MENRSIRSPPKMAKAETLGGGKGKYVIAGIDDIGEDLMRKILMRLPALSFASAACVNRSWNSLCNRLLSSPKLSSAVSFTSSLKEAVNEVVDKVLSEPIRPHFALASIRPSFGLQQAHQLITEKLGSGFPIITNVSEGIIGRDHLTDKFVEVQWELAGEEDSEEENYGAVLPNVDVKPGIILTVGFFPGLKANIIPLFRYTEPETVFLDEFVVDIMEYASTVSDSKSPACILLFADQEMDAKPVLQKMEFAFSPDTTIVGDGGSQFLYRSDKVSTTIRTPESAAIALVFARDKTKPLAIGETKFHAVLSTGISPVGPTYKASAVKCYPTSTCLTGSRETLHEYLDGQTMLEDIYNELGDRIQYHPSFYIGVTKIRKCSVGMEKVRRMRFLEFHEVQGGNEEYLFVDSAGIRNGDPFRFYISNSKAAISSCQKVSDDLIHLKQEWQQSSGSSACKREVFGGIIFTCCGRGDPFFGQPNIDSSPFLENFPGIPFGGTYCAGEIGRGKLRLYDQGNDEGGSIHCLQHVYSAVYLVMSYCPPPPQPLD